MQRKALEGAYNMQMGNVPDIKTPNPKIKGGGKLGKFLAITGGLMYGTDALGSGEFSLNSTFKQNSNASPLKNTVNAIDASADFVDPTIIVGYSTAKQVVGSAYNNISQGKFSAAATDVISAPKTYASNLINGGYGTGQSLA